jgi:hypothetical protein
MSRQKFASAFFSKLFTVLASASPLLCHHASQF